MVHREEDAKGYIMAAVESKLRAGAHRWDPAGDGDGLLVGL